MGWISVPCSSDYPPGERTHRAVPAPAGPSCSSSPECCLFIPLTAPSFLHYKLPAAPLGMHHGVRSQPQYRRSGRFIYYRVCLHSYLRPCLAGPSITHTSACCPSHPPKPQRWQYLCLSPSLSFSLTQPSVCLLYSTSWILVFFCSHFTIFWGLMCSFFPYRLV